MSPSAKFFERSAARRDPVDPRAPDGHRGERHLVEVVVGERAVLERFAA